MEKLMRGKKIFDGKKITVRGLSRKDFKNVKKFQEFINSLINEDAQLSLNKKFSLKEEKKWLKENLRKIKNKKSVYLAAEYDNAIVGTAHIDMGKGRHSHVGTLGISIRKGFRGIGLGTYLMREIIKLAKKELKPKPKVIRLSVFPENKPAIKLYKKLGFEKVAKIPKQIQYKGKLLDEIVMLLCF